MRDALDSSNGHSLEGLTKLLEGLHRRAETGTLMVVAAADARTAADESRGYSLRLAGGELVSIKRGIDSGLPQLQRLARENALERMQWYPLSASAASFARPLMGHAEMMALLRARPDAAAAPAGVDARATARRLAARAGSLFDEFYGPEGPAVLDALLQRHPPQTDPHGFIAACVDRLAPMVGDDHARELMQPG